MSFDPSQRRRLFLASCIALIATSMSFAVRGDIMGGLETTFDLSKVDVGWITGTAFWGFTASIVVGGPLCDALGMRLLMRLAFLGHLAGTVITIFAGGFWGLWIGTLSIGLANGLVEAACNPLIATIYPEQKTRKLNQFHVWFPGGIVIGGLLCFAISSGMGIGGEAAVTAETTQLAWQLKVGLLLVPTVIYGVMFLGVDFPATERVASGVSFNEMLRECGRPLFLIMLVCMLMTAATELGPNQWIANILKHTAQAGAILVLCWISGLMALGRQLAGPIVHRLSPTGVLLASSVISGVGLFLLSVSENTFAVFASATVFAIGICYYWPTMLGFVAERVPRSGAFGLALMGGAGMLSTSFVIPFMGQRYDSETLAALPSGTDLEATKQAIRAGGEAADKLASLEAGSAVATELEQLVEAGKAAQEVLTSAETAGGAATLQFVAILPAVLVVVFLLLFLKDRQGGGYKAESIGGNDQGS